MKKLVFTALVVVAFSGTAMAKTGEVKQNSKSEIKKEVVVEQDCSLARFVAYVDARNVGFTHEQATAASYSVYFMCLGVQEASISQ
jgi:beta-galactosidase/beta-glucuronidase